MMERSIGQDVYCEGVDQSLLRDRVVALWAVAMVPEPEVVAIE